MLYITLLDQFHPGIYSSQVIDVCDYLNRKYNTKIRLVAFLSVRELLKTDAKKKLMELSPNALVLPAFPGLKNFQLTSILLFFICLFTRERIAICRNTFCTRMALNIKGLGLLNKVILDGRSAMAAEMEEYDVFPVEYLRKKIRKFENQAVNESDFRISVSEKLVSYWKEKYNYSGNQHIVIPCTLDRKYFSEKTCTPSLQQDKIKSELGFTNSDIILAYSGSTAPWQSFGLLEKMLVQILESDERTKVLFLSKENSDNKRLRDKYKERFVIKWVDHKDVLSYLQCCDYGILVREQSDTNRVASPVKFAEYLYAGLYILISENLGDFSEFVRKHACGYVLSENFTNRPILRKIEPHEKLDCFELANAHFQKESEQNDRAYSRLADYLRN